MPNPEDGGFHRWRGKLPHQHVPGAAYLLTTNVADGLPQLTPIEKTVVLKACVRWDSQGWKLYSAVAMSTHVHLVAALRADARAVTSVAKLMQSIKGSSSREINLLRSRTGSLWERDYHDSTLDTDTALETAVYYVLNNPVKAGLVKLPEDYPWLWTYWSEAKILNKSQ